MSPDHRTDWEVIERDGLACIAVEGRDERCFDEVSRQEVTFSPDSRRVALPVREGEQWRVLVDDEMGPPVDAVGTLRFAPDGARLAYTALRDGRWHVVVDGSFGEAWDTLLAGSLRFDPTGRRSAYAARRNGRAVVVADGRTLSRHEGIGVLRFSPDGERLGYVARDDGRERLVVNGTVLAEHDHVSDFRFAPDGNDIAWSYRDGAGRWVRFGEGAFGPYTSVTELGYPVAESPPSFVFQTEGAVYVRIGTWVSQGYLAVEAPVFADDGTRWGFIGSDPTGSAVVVDGAVLARESRASGLALSSTNSRFAYVADRGALDFIVHDQGADGFDMVIAESVMFVDGGRLWAALVADLARRRLSVRIEGLDARRSFHLSEAGRITLGSGGDLLPREEALRALRSWVAAEAAILLETVRRRRPGGSPGVRPPSDPGRPPQPAATAER